MTSTQHMKETALHRALQSDDKCANHEVENVHRTWKIRCACHLLTEFYFYLFQKDESGNWRSSYGIGEKEASAFLIGAGLV